MSNWGEKLGRGGQNDVGVGTPMRPEDVPVEKDIFYQQWQQGLITSESPENTPKDAAPDLSDTEVDNTDALVRAPGIRLDRDITPRDATWLFQQAAVDFSTELVVIDPPWLGYKSVGAFTFVNLGLGATTQFGWAAADVGGVLIVSDGLSKTYTRAAGAAVVVDISAHIVARCFATFAGRVFAGAFVDAITGIQALAIAWNAASGAVADWAGLGSGAEFLISNNEQADYIVAMVPIGLQTLGILARKSLWAGYETGVADRPADFQLRFPGLGCASRDSAAATPFGVIYLSDQGVALYDLNQSVVISEPVNALLLPLDYTRLHNYRGAYNEATQRYTLITPFGVYIYQFPKGQSPARWFFRSFVSDSVVVFTNQGAGVYWNSVIGPWNLQSKSWAELVIGEADAPSLTYFGRDGEIGYEDYTAVKNFSEVMDPFWQTKQSDPSVTNIIETHWFEVQYRSQADAEISFTATDTKGALVNTLTKILPSSAGLRKRVLIGVRNMAGMGTELQITYGSTAICAIERIRRVVMEAGTTPTATI